MTTISADDRAAITDLLHRFYWLVDFGRADETPGLFASDGTLTFGPGAPNAGTLNREQMEPAMRARAAQTHVTTRHSIGNVTLALQGNGSVTGYALLTLFRSDDEGRNSSIASVADIDDVYVPEEGSWKILRRTITPVFMRG